MAFPIPTAVDIALYARPLAGISMPGRWIVENHLI